MYGIFASVRVKPEQRERFLQVNKADALCSVRDEPGCLRFNVFQDAADENVYHLFEVYEDEAAFDAHRATPHFDRFFKSLEEWSGGPVEIKPARSVYPTSGQYYAQPVPSGSAD